MEVVDDGMSSGVKVGVVDGGMSDGGTFIERVCEGLYSFQ